MAIETEVQLLKEEIDNLNSRLQNQRVTVEPKESRHQEEDQDEEKEKLISQLQEANSKLNIIIL